MALIWKKFKMNLVFFLAIVGPGLITAVADNDAGGVATYTVAAALFGMASQYLVIPTTLLLAVTQEIGARISIVTGKGLGSLIREKYGVKISVIIFFFYFIVNQGVVLQDVTGLKASLQLFNLPWQPVLVLSCLLLVLVVIKFNFKKLQKVFLFMILFYISYVISAFLVHPDWKEAFNESFVWPKLIDAGNPGYWFALIAVLGTTVTAWGQFFISSYIVDKGLTKNDINANKVEVYSGALLTNGLSWMMAIAVTYTLFVNQIQVTDGYSAALAIKPLAGDFSYILFAIGLFAASILGLFIVPLATAYVFTEMFGFERTLNVDFKTGKVFYIFFVSQIAIGVIVALFPTINLFGLTLYADYLNGAMLPVIMYFLMKFSENKELMGEHVSGKLTKLFVRLCAVMILIAVGVTFFQKVFY
jgi:Mn2+/Fe2+ NRAMP family transporter